MSLGDQIYEWLKALVLAWWNSDAPPVVESTHMPMKNPEPTPPPQPVTPEPPKYRWDSDENIRHSVRVICDEMGFDWEQKNNMCATIYGESEFVLDAKCFNYKTNPDGTLYRDANGDKVLLSTDHGLCQWNDRYHGNEISPDEAVHDPEKAVRLMAKYWKMGETYRRWWIAYKNGRYKQFLTLVQHPIVK